MPDLLQTAPCGYVAFRDDGTIAEVNETLAAMLGYVRHELLGWHIDKMLPPGGRIFYHTYLFPLLKAQSIVEEVYVAFRTKDARDVPVLLNGSRVERDGVFVSDCICLRMIQRHEYEDQLLQARRLAEESSAAKAKFLSMMSHDLRAPLTAIDGNAQLLASGAFGALNDEQAECVREIRDACRTQMSMIGDILEFARMEGGSLRVKPQPVAVADAVARASALVRVQASDAGLQFTADDCNGDPYVVADPDRLQQILLNLLTNAVKFTPPPGEIAIACESDGARVRIHVRDTGIGIAPEHLPRLFTPFVQLESDTVPATRGVGLGLAISRELARAMRGDVTAESTPGRGSVFTIDLPAAQVAATA